MMHDCLTTDRLLLREWREADQLPFAQLNADPRVMEFLPARLSRSESDLLINRIQGHWEHRGFGLCAAELRETGTFVGFIGLSVPSFAAPFTPCIEIGWRLAAEVWGNGLATEGAIAVAKHGFEVLGIEELVSFTTAANSRSRRVMQKLGMIHDVADDFCHPNLPAGHPLSPHVSYRLCAGTFRP